MRTFLVFFLLCAASNFMPELKTIFAIGITIGGVAAFFQDVKELLP